MKKEAKAAWNSLKHTYIALGLTHLQAYLNEYTVRRYLRMSSSEEELRQNLLQMCLSIPAIPYGRLIKHHQKSFLATAA